jgi:hypothetical protein
MRGLLLRKQITSLIAPAGAGKSSLGLTIALHLAAGRDFGPFKCVNGPYRVAVLSVEEDQDELQRRFEALRVHYKFTQEDAANVFIIDALEEPIMAVADRRGVVKRTKFADEMERQLYREAIDVVVVDPFVEIWNGNENDNNQVKTAAAIIRQMIRGMNAACLLMHHVRKGTMTPGDMDSARGASSLSGLVRLAQTLTNMTPDDAEGFGLDSPSGFVRMDQAKGNYVPASEKAAWFKFRSIEIENGDAARNLPCDLVGILEPWTPPKAFDGVSADDVNRVLDLIDKGNASGDRYTKHAGSKERYVVPMIAEELDRTEEQAATILRAWLESKLVDEKTYPELNKGKGGKGLFVDNSKRPASVTRIF